MSRIDSSSLAALGRKISSPPAIRPACSTLCPDQLGGSGHPGLRRIAARRKRGHSRLLASCRLAQVKATPIRCALQPGEFLTRPAVPGIVPPHRNRPELARICEDDPRS